MAVDSAISWTEATQNFWYNCHKVSPACAYCYAERWAKKTGRDFDQVTRAKPATFNAPLRWEPKTVFTCSLSDFFIEEADGWRDEAWNIINQTRQHKYLILSKRWDRVYANPEKFIPWYKLPQAPWPNVRFGCSAENQPMLEARLPKMLTLRAAGFFVSAEPLLGDLNFERIKIKNKIEHATIRPMNYAIQMNALQGTYLTDSLIEFTMPSKVSAVIVGGESGGPESRRLVNSITSSHIWNRGKVSWVPKLQALEQVENIQKQCERNDTTFFFKQWGGPRPDSGGHLVNGKEYQKAIA